MVAIMSKKYVLLLILIMIFSLKSMSVYAVNFSYFRNITLINTNNFDLIDYQIPFNLTYTNQQVDFADIRLTNSTSGNSDNWLLNYSYYIENKNNSNWAKIWFKIDNISANNNRTVYLYYGNNTSISNLSNGYNTFILFEDFENGTMQNWTARNGATCTIINNNSAYLGDRFLEIGFVFNSGCSRDYQTNLTHYIMHVATRSFADNIYGFICEGVNCINQKGLWAQHFNTAIWYLYNATTAENIGSYNQIWQEYDIYKNDSHFINISIYNLSQNILNGSWTNGTHITTNQPTFYFYDYSGKSWVDNFWIRTWNNNVEPNLILSEEQNVTEEIGIMGNLANIRCLDNQTLYKEKIYTLCSNNECSTNNISSNQTCQYGCDNITSTCSPAPFQQDIINYVIIIGIIIFGLVLIKRL